jgi:hypothetical protein
VVLPIVKERVVVPGAKSPGWRLPRPPPGSRPEWRREIGEWRMAKEETPVCPEWVVPWWQQRQLLQPLEGSKSAIKSTKKIGFKLTLLGFLFQPHHDAGEDCGRRRGGLLLHCLVVSSRLGYQGQRRRITDLVDPSWLRLQSPSASARTLKPRGRGSFLLLLLFLSSRGRKQAEKERGHCGGVGWW